MKQSLKHNDPQRYVFIDSLRGIAAVWVLLFHFYFAIGGDSALKTGYIIETIFRFGEQGVFIFFVLSGFVISKSVNWDALSARYFWRFLLRRSVRLDIPYWFIILLTGFSVTLLTKAGLSSIESPGLTEYIINILYLDNLTGVNSIVAVGWTLQYEIQFYLFFILLAWILKSANVKVLYVWLCFYITGLTSFLYWFSWFPFYQPGLFLNYWMYFLLGAITHWVLERKLPEWQYGLGVLMVFIHFFIFLNVSSLVCMITSLLLFGAGKLGTLTKWLKYNWLVFLGIISYSIYLFHPFIGNRILRFIAGRFEPAGIFAWITLLSVIILTLIVCYFFFRLIEKPSHELSRKIRLKN